jgi:hypothetical protein
VECEGTGYATVTKKSVQRISDVHVRFSGNTEIQTRHVRTERGGFLTERQIKSSIMTVLFVHKIIILAVNNVESFVILCRIGGQKVAVLIICAECACSN